MAKVKESSTAYLTVRFLDKLGAEAIPSEVTWTVHDKLSDTLLLGPTDETPGASIELTLPPSVNAILDTRRLLETRVVTVIASFGVDDGLTSKYEYFVENLKYIT